MTETLMPLCAEVERILGMEAVIPTAALGELGFDSLSTVELVLACEQIYGVFGVESLSVEHHTTLVDLDQQIRALAS